LVSAALKIQVAALLDILQGNKCFKLFQRMTETLKENTNTRLKYVFRKFPEDENTDASRNVGFFFTV
jgi:hypothetical protein